MGVIATNGEDGINETAPAEPPVVSVEASAPVEEAVNGDDEEYEYYEEEAGDGNEAAVTTEQLNEEYVDDNGEYNDEDYEYYYEDEQYVEE